MQVEPMAQCLSRLLARGLEAELCARCAVLLLRAHQVSRMVHYGDTHILLVHASDSTHCCDGLRCDLQASVVAAPASMALTLESLRMQLRQVKDEDGISLE